jgi:hypothetical protein
MPYERKFGAPKDIDILSLRSRLINLEHAGHVLSEGNQLAFLERAAGIPMSDEKRAGVLSANRDVREGLSFLRRSLSIPELIPPAVRAAHTLVCSYVHGDGVMSMLAENAHHIAEYIKTDPSFIREGVGQLCETREVFTIKRNPDTEEVDLAKAEMIRTALHKILPYLEQFFSTNPEDAELKWRIHMLGELSHVETFKEHTWIKHELARHIVAALRSPSYRTAEDVDKEKTIEDPNETPENIELRIFENPISYADIERVLTDTDYRLSAHVLQRITKEFGLPMGTYMKIPNTRMPRGRLGFESSRVGILMDQFDRIHEIESERPGAAAELYKRFGLRWFSRYPSEALIRQYDERNLRTPYGVCMSAVEDGNASFFERQEIPFLRKMTRDAEAAGFGVRFIECNGRKEMARIFAKMHSKYGKSHKISFLVMRAHGWRWGLGLGENEEDGDFVAGDIHKEGDFLNAEQFEENPSLVFDACSVGRRGGLAQRLSKLLSGTAYAPRGLTSSISSMEIEKIDGRLSFKPQYLIDRDTEESDPHIYIHGRKR